VTIMTTLWTRRQFITRSAAGLALVPALAERTSLIGKRPLRTAIVGLGEHGRRHIAAGLVDGIDLRGLCDIDQGALDRAQHCCRAWLGREAIAVRDFDQLLAGDEVDAIAVATAASDRAAITAKALACGKHVYVEPPLATDLAQSETLLDAARGSSALLWQATREPGWVPEIVTDFLESATRRDRGQLTVVRTSEGPPVASASWDVNGWLDVTDAVSRVSSAGPGSVMSLRGPSPTGVRRELHASVPRGLLTNVRFLDIAGACELPAVCEWHLIVRAATGQDTLWLAMTSGVDVRPNVRGDLASWRAFAACVERGPDAWAREHERAHRSVVWHHALAEAGNGPRRV
jgi:hypothetical protein